MKLKHSSSNVNPLVLIKEKDTSLKKAQDDVENLLEEFNQLKIHANELEAYVQQEREGNVWLKEKNTQLKGEQVQLTEKLVEVELIRDEKEENFKNATRDFINNARKVEYLHSKVVLKKIPLQSPL